MTESERAIRNAIHLLEVAWGNGRFDKGELIHTLKQGLPKPGEPARTVKRPVVQASELLDLDDNGGH